ncbi:MAG: complex I subunit 4 family protein [Thermodesulfobacteriota bacterium]
MPPIPLLSIIVLVPVVGAFCALAAGARPLLCRGISLGFTLVELALVSSLFFLPLEPHSFGPQGTWLLLEDFPWLPGLGARISLGLDGLSLLLLLLTSFVTGLCVLISWRAIATKVGSFHFFLLFLEGTLMGLFMATDLLLFYLFWEIQILPMFFLVGIWGHDKRIYAAVKFILFTLSGSLLMLIALIILYILHGQQTGVYTFALHQLVQTRLSAAGETWLYAAFLLAFAIKIPLFPLHTWLPDTHTEAPTAGSVDLAGLLLKTGFYAVFRFAFPLFPNAAQASTPLLLGLGLVGLFYTGWIALAQTDLKRLIAYSSIGHMAMMVLGLAVFDITAMSGSLLQMINHGISTAALFIMVGMLDERLGTRDFRVLGGLWGKMPVFSAFFLFFALASMGLPGLNNFVGEILILVGLFQEYPLVGAVSFGGMILVAIYILRMVQDTVFGPPKTDQPLGDVNSLELFVLIVLALPVLYLGLHPGPVLRLLDHPVQRLLGYFIQVAALHP